MQYILDTTETIPKGVGFSHFDPVHLFWLGVFVLFAWEMCRIYKRHDAAGRKKIQRFMAGAIVADELFKMAVLFIGGNYTAKYLPLHLCSVNIILVAIHAVKPGKVLDNFLYAVCIPAAVAALLFPSWTKLPMLNFMSIHSFTVHILLAVYPMMMVAGKDIVPDHKQIPRCLLLLSVLALVALGANLIFDTNFMFLMSAAKNNPLYIFKKHFGSHLVGFAVIIPILLVAMYAPIVIKNRRAGHVKL